MSPAASAAPAASSPQARPRIRGIRPARARPAASAIAATSGLAGPAADMDGTRPSNTTPAPARGPAAARTTTRAPRKPHRTRNPATNAAAPARLSVAPAPASRLVAASDREARPGVAARRESATSARGTSNAAAAFAYVSVDEARHKPCDGKPHGRSCNATPSHPVAATTIPTVNAPPSKVPRVAMSNRRHTDTAAAVPAPNSAQLNPVTGVPACAARSSAQTASERPAMTIPPRSSATDNGRTATATANATAIRAATSHCIVLKTAPCPKEATATAPSSSKPDIIPIASRSGRCGAWTTGAPVPAPGGYKRTPAAKRRWLGLLPSPGASNIRPPRGHYQCQWLGPSPRGMTLHAAHGGCKDPDARLAQLAHDPQVDPSGFTRAGTTPGPSGRTHETLATAPSCWNAPPEADGPDALRFGEPGEHHSPRPTLPGTERIGQSCAPNMAICPSPIADRQKDFAPSRSKPLCCQEAWRTFLERGDRFFSLWESGRGRSVDSGPGVAWPKSRCSGGEPAALAAEAFPVFPPRPPVLAAEATLRASAWRRAKMASLIRRFRDRSASLGVLPSASLRS